VLTIPISSWSHVGKECSAVPEKGYTVARDLKVAGSLAAIRLGCLVIWHAWQTLGDLEVGDLEEEEYSYDAESLAHEIERTVAWLRMIRTSKGFEDIIDEEVQSNDKGFKAAFKCSNSELFVVRRAHGYDGQHTAQRVFVCCFSQQEVSQD